MLALVVDSTSTASDVGSGADVTLTMVDTDIVTDGRPTVEDRRGVED